VAADHKLAGIFIQGEAATHDSPYPSVASARAYEKKSGQYFYNFVPYFKAMQPLDSNKVASA
jgi:hypothetical protein